MQLNLCGLQVDCFEPVYLASGERLAISYFQVQCIQPLLLFVSSSFFLKQFIMSPYTPSIIGVEPPKTGCDNYAFALA